MSRASFTQSKYRWPDVTVYGAGYPDGKGGYEMFAGPTSSRKSILEDHEPDPEREAHLLWFQGEEVEITDVWKDGVWDFST
jgi:hypothetical protein